ncbi:MAG TPA: dTMP kinase [Acidimicrobiales bacterium]|nr:dTMP kinase [Acidimicrobiales bacterium]
MSRAAGGRGCFVVFEGGEGSGKSTQARLLAGSIGGLLTREPGGTTVGERLRDVLLDPGTGSLHPRTEVLLMAAARAEHVATVIEPALAAGRDVVCDRFSGSSVAYQGHGRGLYPVEVARVSDWAAGGLAPDLVVLLDLSVEAAGARLSRERDRFERAGTDFHEAVRAGFLAQAAEAPERWLVLDAERAVDDLHNAILAETRRRFGRP